MSSYENEEKEKGLGFKVGAILLAIVIIVVALLGFMCTFKILPGYAGIIYNADGGVQQETLNQGYHIVAPWQKVIEYPVSTEAVTYAQGKNEGKKDKDTSIWVTTKDSKQVNVDVTYMYHMDQASLPEIFTNYRGRSSDDIEENIMKNSMYQAINEVTSQYALMDIAGDKLPIINDQILVKFKDILKDGGIVIERINLSNVRPDEYTAAAIQNVINAQNALAQSKVEQQQAAIEAEKVRIAAKGKADAAILEAQGTAEANNKVSSSLTQMLIDWKMAQTWDGKYPTTYLSGSGANLLLQR